MKLIMFDDGTLIRSHGVGRRAMANAIEAVVGIPEPLAGISLGGKTDPLIIEEALAGGGAELDGQATAIYRRYLELLEDGLTRSEDFEVLGGVAALLHTLAEQEGMGLALGTGNIEGGARLKLKRAGLNHYFPTGGFGSDARERVALVRAGIRKAEAAYRTTFECVWVVGDTPRDIEAARAVGAKVLGVATGDYDEPSLAAHHPDALVPNLCARSDLIQTLDAG